ncbi:glycohydrolase toxin TNT-related protein, partial [Sinomicrobium oceani]|uniref:glycohydrolase toxin TNT-related protein n=1 Tax=Sinomicrobium oceani TaxID=1150368 RepID=UPI00227D2F27
EIHEQGKERINFQYNASMGRAHMYYGGEESDKMQRRYRKHYSADGSMEIREDTQNGKTTFITYIGGDAYSAPLIWHSDQGTTTTNNYYYLHRDYLGSILSITDKSGTVKEKRHFDAWGNIVKLTNGSGTALNNFTILDRGYTGHEHLAGVGLVHMNGRLYDPVMHRFLMPDNYVQDHFNTQFFNRYGYALNNPLIYTDPTGEIIPLIVIGVGAIVGAYIGGSQANGTWNPLKWNWKSSDTWIGIGGGAVIGAAGGAVATAVAGSIAAVGVSSLMSTAIGGAAGGVIQGGGFSLMPGGDGNVLRGAALGAVSGFVGGAAGHVASKGINNIMVNGFNISSPVLKGAVGGAAGGAAGGYAGGFASGLIMTGDFTLAHKAGVQGFGMGAGIGAVSGFATQYAIAKQQGVNPWSGKFENWPSNDGFKGNTEIKMLEIGEMIDRYGQEAGKYLSPEGTPFEQRSLLPSKINDPYNVYEVVKPFEVQSGKVAPYFYQKGGGIQYKLIQYNVKWYLDQGYLIKR